MLNFDTLEPPPLVNKENTNRMTLVHGVEGPQSDDMRKPTSFRPVSSPLEN